jgi:threonine dehydrogenase-like Zn-dependent dehydrogenase
MPTCAMREKNLIVDTLPDPEPQEGQVLVKTLACGICGSDLHRLKHPDEFAATLHDIAEGRTRVDPLIAGKIGVEDVPEAFG